jgi:hypothetical protein
MLSDHIYHLPFLGIILEFSSGSLFFLPELLLTTVRSPKPHKLPGNVAVFPH